MPVKGSVKKKRKAQLRSSGWTKSYMGGAHIRPREWAMRHLHECGFDFEKTTASLRSRAECHGVQAASFFKEGARNLAESEKQQCSMDLLAIKELGYLRQKGPDFWLPRVTKLFHRDLRAMVRKNPADKMSVEETAALLLGLAGADSKQRLDGRLIKKALEQRGKDETRVVLDGALQDAIYLAQSRVYSAEELVKFGARNKVLPNVLDELSAAQKHDEELLLFLKRLERMRPDLKYERISALRNRDFTKKEKPFKPPFEL